MRPLGGSAATAVAALFTAHVAVGVAWLGHTRVALPRGGAWGGRGNPLSLAARQASEASPLPYATGPTGAISSTVRFTDGLATLVAPGAIGKTPAGTVYWSSADNFLTTIYKDVFLDAGAGLVEHHCLDDDSPACAISPHHPAISAVVRFFFDAPHTNTRGTSVQTQLACQCMNADCSKIVTVALRRPPAADAGSPGANGSCTYQAVALEGDGGQPPTLHSCVSALMHIGTVDRRPEGPFPLEDFEYNVTRFGDSAWSAQGYRNGFVADATPPRVLANITAARTTFPDVADASLPSPSFTPVTTVEDAPAEVCAALGPTLGLAASHHASAQDAAATGTDQGSFLDTPPPLLTDTDIAMTVCGALLGVVAVLSLFRATWSMQELRWIPKLLAKYVPRSQRKDFNRDLAIAQGAVIFFGLMLYALETSALHVALASEWAAFGWRGAFVHLDLTLISRGEGDQPLVPFANRDSTGTLFVATALVGVARYRVTRRVVSLLLVIILDAIMAAAVMVQLIHWTLSAKRVDARVAAEETNASDGSSCGEGDEEKGAAEGTKHTAPKSAWRPPSPESSASAGEDSAGWPPASDSRSAD
ncbi:hypothetical protein MMPV_009043 [Pyropia vietnamensis]